MHQTHRRKKILPPKYQSHHVPALRPQKGEFVASGKGHQTVERRIRTVSFPVFHVPPCPESFNYLKVIQTGYIVESEVTLTKLPINVCIIQERLSLEWQSLAFGSRRRKMCQRLRFHIKIEAYGIQVRGYVFREREDAHTNEKDQEGENERAFSLSQQPFHPNSHFLILTISYHLTQTQR